MPRTNLTQSFVDSDECVCPEGRTSFEYNDTQVVGLYLGVTPRGCKTYRFSYKDNQNKRRHIKLGLASDISLKAARAEAQKLRARILNSEDPAEERTQRNATPIWDEFFEQDYLPHAKQKLRSWRNMAQMQSCRVSDKFGTMKLDRITRQQVEQFHIGLKEDGLAPGTSDRYLAFIRRALNLACEWGLLQKNPAKGIRPFNADNQVERYLTDDELRRLMRVLQVWENRPFALLVTWLICSGCRSAEARLATHECIDYENRVWIIQSETSKSKRRRSVPLNDVALSVLDELKARGQTTGYLFVGKRGPYRHLTKNWARVCEAADLKGLRLHDLRHSYASMLVNAGHSLYAVQQALGHSDPKVTMRYAHLSKASLQKAANSAAERIQAAMK